MNYLQRTKLASARRRGLLPIKTLVGDVSDEGWSPYSVFADGSQGLFIDLDDFTTLFQDTAGTIPVTAAGQSVGKALDRSGRGNHITFTVAPVLQLNGTTGHHYLVFNGSTTWGSTASVDFTATDKVSVFAGLRKLSDANTGTVCELSTNSTTTAGTFALFAPISAGPSFQYRSSGSIVNIAANSGVGEFPAPYSAVLCGTSAISADTVSIRVNGVVEGQNLADQGTGNYGNHPLYIGRRGGTSLPFNGHIYSILIVAKLLSTTDRDNIEDYMAARVGVTLP